MKSKTVKLKSKYRKRTREPSTQHTHTTHNTQHITYGSVCSGIEAASVAWHCLGFKPSWFSEIEPFPSAVLADHFPEVHNHGDFTKIAKKILAGKCEAPDILVGGTPCQAYSLAGLRKSLDDARGQLSLSFTLLADAMDRKRCEENKEPSIILWENVPGVLATKDNAFGCFLAGLAGETSALVPAGKKWTHAGYVSGPTRTVAWRILDAQHFGVAQRRKRVFVIASARTDIDPREILFEFDGLRRDFAPRREQRQATTTATAPRIEEGNSVAVGTDCYNGSITGDIACTMGTSGSSVNATGPTVMTPKQLGKHQKRLALGSRGDITGAKCASDYKGVGNQYVSDGKLVLSLPFQETADCLYAAYGTKWNGNAAAFNGSLFAFTSKDYGNDATVECAPTLRSMSHNKSHANGGGQLAVAYPKRNKHDGAKSFTVSVNSGGFAWESPVSPTLATTGGATANQQYGFRTADMRVRRLTPIECERLQGFPDNWTRIRWRGNKRKDCPDGPRYKATGNSMAVPVMRWIGFRIHLAVSGQLQQRIQETRKHEQQITRALAVQQALGSIWKSVDTLDRLLVATPK
jgi:DNA (cytosine-5)-methyltransferase 1